MQTTSSLFAMQADFPLIILSRRMASLSKELAGVVLPHDSSRCHLDSSGNTIVTERELQNFRKAGELLADIWSATTIDDYAVTIVWVDPSVKESNFRSFSDTKLWGNYLENHVQISKYCLEMQE